MLVNQGKPFETRSSCPASGLSPCNSMFVLVMLTLLRESPMTLRDAASDTTTRGGLGHGEHRVRASQHHRPEDGQAA